MKRQIRIIPAIGVATCVFWFTLITGATASTVWDMATPYPDGNFHTQNIKLFADDIAKETSGEINIKVHSNASLLKMPDIKRGVQTKQAVLGEILLSAYGNEDPFFELDGIPFVSTGYDTAKVVWDMTRPFIEKRFNNNKS